MRFALFIATIMTFAAQAQANNFPIWLHDFKAEAIEQGISPNVVRDAFADIQEPLDSVITLDRKQPEGTKSFDEYSEGILTDKRIDKAQQLRRDHRALFSRIKREYGVEPNILLALWSIESNFGKTQGHFSLIESLTTLAYDGRRSEFFRKELMNALRMSDREKIAPQSMEGSWAGAMGQVQFMPSSYLSYAVDFDGDGHKDIWTNDADALASMANYLQTVGWKQGQGWGFRVQVPAHALPVKTYKSLEEWRRLGLRRANGAALPRNHRQAKLIMPDADNAFLVFSNYDVLLDWNRSTYFATTVGMLADAIGAQ